MKIQLTGDEVEAAIHAYLESRGFRINCPRILQVNGEVCTEATVICDNSKTYAWDGVKYAANDPLARG